MKRILALGLCLALLCPAARAAEEAKGGAGASRAEIM